MDYALPSFSLHANVVDIFNRQIYPATVNVEEGHIASISKTNSPATSYLLPGFVDAHVHIESSMLVPGEFARATVVHGTVAAVSDPHEIGNVLGVLGVRFMLDNGADIPFKFCFGAPSCVPATSFETAGAGITANQVAELLDDPRIGYLSEMMNVPGVLNGDPQVIAKIEAAQHRGKPIDGHAPGLQGEAAKKYFGAGISTDHECSTIDEAIEKIELGAKILIREGSAARNFDVLSPLIDAYPDKTMLCSDDIHPDELLTGHINRLVRRAVAHGLDLFHVLRAASINPVEHYRLAVGLLREGDPADFIEVRSLETFHVHRTWIDGQLVAENGQTTILRKEPRRVNRFVASEVCKEDIALVSRGQTGPKEVAELVHVIEAIDGQLLTNRLKVPAKVVDQKIVSDPDRDILKMVVVNRYASTLPAVAFVKNFGLKRGAIASSVAHDSHNVIAVGPDDEQLCEVIHLVMQAGGGLAAVGDGRNRVLPLPVAGLMATGPCPEVGAAYRQLDRMAKDFGSQLQAPYMTLSFMALLVIPSIKLSDRGLFDGESFELIPTAVPLA
ncbi:MAG: adenine deaminase [Pirellulales bacterium]|nr:adenine deaminase [Pirellulales bacterium]